MRLFTYKRRLFTAEFWDFNQLSDESGEGSRQYFFSHEFVATLGTSTTVSINLYTDEPLRIMGFVKNLRDVNGEELVPDAQWRISQVEPQFNIWGLKEGYAVTAATM